MWQENDVSTLGIFNTFLSRLNYLCTKQNIELWLAQWINSIQCNQDVSPTDQLPS